ncbi:synapse differentiation-inducing gene protein 1-like isoform X2 [Lampris incognitus]|uniref:synapse differentiation-inducing gene protein 1-like isoform X2 n=1 Tax=Lampris incognitus TaxID=2546036 RepID=UPI0024B57520|nr:synapse differentiation-inducing gene protein 1-like isoform X2 [Lampris incognitus]XP_056141542.1 synapse differentiation-inducing gene protein 1-like isoform X2 [Lampris incognitus]
MNPNMSPSAPPPGWTSDDKSAMPPPPYQDHPQYPNAGYPYPAQAQGYGPPPQYGGQPYGQQPYPGQQYPPVTAAVTVQPTVYVTQAPLARAVNDYLGYSIFTMLCCCLPLGIAAFIYSISTRKAVQRGDLVVADQSSAVARRLNHAALGIGIILTICFIRFSFVYFKSH